MPLIPFPSVPAYPGVPALVRALNIPPVITIGLGITQNILASASQSQTQWGIFDSSGNQLGASAQSSGIGAAIVAAVAGPAATLSFSDLEFARESKISNFPVEEGSFANYNKVQLPANPIVSLALAGSVSERTTFLAAIDAASKTTDLYSVVTPEAVYIDCNIERYTYQRRQSKGATLIIVEISLEEIRQVSAAFTTASPINNPQNVGATNQTNSGLVQPTPPTPSTLKSLYNQFNALGGVQ